MKISNIAELEAVLVLLHKHNVHTAVVDGVTLQLTLKQEEVKQPADAGVFLDPVTGAPMTEDEILFWAERRGN